MTAAQFRHALHLGLGRAILYAQNNDVTPFREIILDACLHCYSYDIQVEGTRSSYMYELVTHLPDKQFYFNQVTQSLKDCGDDYDAVQRFHFAACMALDGDASAKAAMYDAYAPEPSNGGDIGRDFVLLDGINGLLFVADKIGGLIQSSDRNVELWTSLNESVETFGEHPTFDALQQAGGTNPHIEAYRLVAEKKEHRPAPNPSGTQEPNISEWTYEQLFANTPANNGWYWWRWGESASDEQLLLAANGLSAAKELRSQRAHLAIFRRRVFPLDPQPIIALTEIDERRIGWAATQALAKISHPAVRAEALRLVNTKSKWRRGAINMLIPNFQPGDHRLALNWFANEDDPETLHSYEHGLRVLWGKHPNGALELEMLELLYERNPCSFCRERVVSRLLELNALREDYRQECAFDANDNIRELVHPNKEKST